MTTRQKVAIGIAAALIVLGLGAYGTFSLMDKMNQVKELNGQVAEADDSDRQPDSDGTSQPGGRDDEEEPASGDSDDPGRGTEDSPGSGTAAGGGSTATGAEGDPASPGTPQSTDKPTAPGAGQAGSDGEDSGTGAGSGSGGAGGDGAGSPEASPPPADPKERKRDIDQAMTASMESLRTTCKAKSSGLVAQIKAELASNKDAAMETIQKEYLGQIVAAEAECDAQFDGLVGQAKEQYKAAGIAESELPNWSAEYDNAKAQARSDALTEIASAME